MARRNFIVGMDIGTTQVRVIVGEPRPDGTIGVIGLGLSPSDGMKKGAIVDLELAVESIASAVEEAERMAGIKIDSAYVGLKGLSIELINNRGIVAVAADDREIHEEDVERALQATRVIALPLDREIVDIIPREYIVDGFDGIRDPVGMLGVRLEVDAMIVTSPMTSLRNLLRCIDRAGIEVKGFVLQSMANAEVSLSTDEKDLGVLLVDIGGGVTEIAFFQQGKLRSLAVVPLGGDHITGDLAMGLRTSFYNAENLKLDHGQALLSMAGGEENIEITRFGSRERQNISERDICRFVEPRVREIFELVKDEAAKMGWSEIPPAGIVLSGGVSAMEGVVDVARFVFDSDQIRKADCDYIGIQNPIYTVSVGLLYYVLRYQPRFYLQERGKTGRKQKKGLIQKLKNWVADFME